MHSPEDFPILDGVGRLALEKSRNNVSISDSVMTIECSTILSCHPSSRSEPVRAIQVLLLRSPAADLHIFFRLHGDISGIRLPSAALPRSAAGLWQHTCFEAFVAVEGQPSYYEFNLAPSGEWAAYAFRDYRDGGPPANRVRPPRIAVRCTETRLELDALIQLDGLYAINPRAPLRVGLSAVVEASHGTLSYWALKHPPGKPDFHHVDTFALRIEPPAAE